MDQCKDNKLKHDDIFVEGIPPGPKSQALLERLDKSIGQSNYTGLYGIVLHKGLGPYMEDLDGFVYLDCLAAASVNVLGYGVKGIPESLFEIALSLQNNGFIYSPNVQAVDLAEKLIEITPVPSPKRVILGLSGSDCNGGALEAVRKYTKKPAIIHFKNAYHGSTGLSQQASGFGLLNQGIYPTTPDFISVDFPTTKLEGERTLAEVERHLLGGTVGGLIAEVFQGDAGVFLPPEGFFKQLKALLEHHNAVLIVDEVQSGMGRTGKWWASDHEGLEPDILVAGKGLGGGFIPISAAVGRKEILDALEPGQQLFTFTGHPGGSLAAKLVIEHIEKEGLIKHAAEIGLKLKTGLEAIMKEYSEIIVAIRGKGLMIGMEINVFQNESAGVIFATRTAEKGIYVGYFGTTHQVVRIEPPFVLTDYNVAEILEVIREVAWEVRNNKIPQETLDNVKKYSIGL